MEAIQVFDGLGEEKVVTVPASARFILGRGSHGVYGSGPPNGRATLRIQTRLVNRIAGGMPTGYFELRVPGMKGETPFRYLGCQIVDTKSEKGFFSGQHDMTTFRITFDSMHAWLDCPDRKSPSWFKTDPVRWSRSDQNSELVQAQ
jgi:hypothetical protein